MSLIPDQHIGHAAGLGTSFSWTASSLFFAAAARRLGPTVLNTIRLALAVVMLGVTHRVLFGVWIPALRREQVYFLGFSGLIGLTIGDQAGFAAFNAIGPRLTALVFTTAPLMAAMLGWVVLGEALSPTAWLGMSLTICGVGWVVVERAPSMAVAHESPHRLRGIVYALIAAACQAGGLLLSKKGIGHDWLPPSQHLAPQAATLTRVACGMVASLPILAIYGRSHGKQRFADEDPSARTKRRVQGVLFGAAGAVFGPFLGVWMNLVAGDKTSIGVAQTLSSLPPIFLIPCVAILHKERVTERAVFGAIIAVGGTAMLFWK